MTESAASNLTLTLKEVVGLIGGLCFVVSPWVLINQRVSTLEMKLEQAHLEQLSATSTQNHYDLREIKRLLCESEGARGRSGCPAGDGQ